MSDGPAPFASQPGGTAEELPSATSSQSLRLEADTVRWLYDETRAQRPLPILEARAVVRSLYVAMRAEAQLKVPVLRLGRFEEYPTTHAFNVSVVAMALAEELALEPRVVRAVGLAGLLYDIGTAFLPPALLMKPSEPTREEWDIIARHPIEGARLLLSSPDDLSLAATVAYEHHILADGSGYPHLTFPRATHWATRLIQICDIYDSLRSHRPHRNGVRLLAVLDYVEQRAGTEFDGDIARAFTGMMRRFWVDKHVVVLSDEETKSVYKGKR